MTTCAVRHGAESRPSRISPPERRDFFPAGTTGYTSSYLHGAARPRFFFARRFDGSRIARHSFDDDRDKTDWLAEPPSAPHLDSGRLHSPRHEIPGWNPPTRSEPTAPPPA